MASNIKKASSAIRKSFRSRRFQFASVEKENNNNMMMNTVTATQATGGGRTTLQHSRARIRSASTSALSGDENGNSSTVANLGTPPSRTQVALLKRGTSMTQSMRDAVGNLRQKLKMSTKRRRLDVTQTKAATRRHTIGGREARRHSALQALSPRSGHTHVKASLSVETPTRLRREVESLTANMQALNALTPNTLEGRTRTRKSPPLTNGSLKMGRFSHKRVSQV